MFQFKHLLLLGLLWPTALHAAAQNPTTTTQPKGTLVIQAELRLTDGSRILGTFLSSKFTFTTSLGKLTAPWRKIRRMNFFHKKKKVKIFMKNGDKLTGRLPTQKLRLRTLIGLVSVSYQHIQVMVLQHQIRRTFTLQKGLQLHYTFNPGHRLRDQSGNKNHGKSTGAGLSTSLSGHPKSALSLDGLNDYVMIPNHQTLALNKTSLSISVWLKIAKSEKHNFGMILSKGGCDLKSKGGYNLYYDDRDNKNTIIFNIGHPKAGFRSGSIAKGHIVYNKWFHLVVVSQAGQLQIFINGKSLPVKVTGAYKGVPMKNNQPLYIGWGGPKQGCSSWLGGNLDEVRLYNRSLIQNEIEALYKSQP